MTLGSVFARGRIGQVILAGGVFRGPRLLLEPYERTVETRGDLYHGDERSCEESQGHGT
jgi:hypothetical protein